jgi:hypothetical protein
VRFGSLTVIFGGSFFVVRKARSLVFRHACRIRLEGIVSKRLGSRYRIGIGIAVVVAIGLIWSVAVMSQWVPVTSAEMSLAAVIQPYEAGRHKAAAQ